jgi:uncharacterized protein (DUF924 family)
MRPENIIRYWQEAGPTRWFLRDPVFDGALSIRFKDLLADARRGALDAWTETAEGRLGLVILLDQFSRNIHRGTPLAFAGDAKALALARRAVGAGDLQAFPAPLASWLVMPFEHAEDLDAQMRGVALFRSMGLAEMEYWAKVHLDIIARFGRFPHRNPILGRPSRPDEIAFLAAGGFSG